MDYASKSGTAGDEPLSKARANFRISEIQEQNWSARTQKALALAGPGRWDDDMPLPAAHQYIQTFGGDAKYVADRADILTGPSYNGISATAGRGTYDDPRTSGILEVRASAEPMLFEDLRRLELEYRNRNESIEPTIGSAFADEALQRAAGTVLGVAGIVHGGVQFASDQVWTIGNALTGGWLANNVPAAQAAAARNIELGNSLLNLPGQLSRGALRAVTGNWHGAAQSASNALQLNQIQAANAKGDYLSAQVITTQTAINVAGLAVGGLGAARAGLGMAAVQDVRMGAQLVAEDVVSQGRAAASALDQSVFIFRPTPSGLHGSIGVPSSFDSLVPIRITTVTAEMSHSFQGMGYVNPLTNKFTVAPLGETMAVDHIFPSAEIVRMPGFKTLTKSQMTSIIQDATGELGNLQPLPKSFNSSKGSDLNWTTYKGRALEPSYARDLRIQQSEIQQKISDQIRTYQQQNLIRVR